MNARERRLLWILAAVAGVWVLRGAKGFVMSGMELIKRWEGKRLDAYQDVAGLWTIGYGHLVRPGEPYHPYGPVRSITEAEAEQLLARDMSAARDAVARAVTVPLSQNERGALESLAFNIGANAFASSTLVRKLNAGDKAGAADEFLRWIHAGGKVVQGLVNRRHDERNVFLA